MATAKTLRQADPVSYSGPTNALAHLWKMYGPRGLFVGLVPAVLGSNVASALYFGGYEVCADAAELIPPICLSTRCEYKHYSDDEFRSTYISRQRLT